MIFLFCLFTTEETKEAEEAELQQCMEEQCQAEEVAQHQEQERVEQERQEEEAYTESAWQATEEWCRSQVHAEAAQRWVVVEVPTVDVMEFQELTGTLEVDQEVGLGRDKGKGPETALESMAWGELWKCDSCEKQGVKCMRPQVSGQWEFVLPHPLSPLYLSFFLFCFIHMW